MNKVITPNEIAEIGDRIYDKEFRAKYEGTHDGNFLAIDIDNEIEFFGENAEDALDKAESANPNGNYYLVKIGSETAFYVGYTGEKNNGMDWSFQQSA